MNWWCSLRGSTQNFWMLKVARAFPVLALVKKVIHDLIIKSYVILMKYSFVVSLFYVHHIIIIIAANYVNGYACDTQNYEMKNCINLLFGFLHRVRSYPYFVLHVLCVVLFVGEIILVAASCRYTYLYNHKQLWNTVMCTKFKIACATDMQCFKIAQVV